MTKDGTVVRVSEARMEGVGKRYGGTWAVRDISLSIRPGEFYTLLGPSGSGKTTLLRMLAGFITPDEGRIVVDDEPIDDVPPWKRNLGMVFRDYALWPHLSVFENVAFGLRERGARGGDGAYSRRPAPAPASRRAALRAGRAAPRPHAPRARAPASRGRHHHAVRHP
ncbi:MAG: hypothetical protein DMD77_11005 [Candidatus Rokuibacteriota bacterium]|nr:MAG: hypothetical protein DMD77_11005 [Candidatus Rokubacteria bacterium]